MDLKNSFLKALAQVGLSSAKKAAGTASQYGIYQTTEPKGISITRVKKNA
jgi:cyclic lactone autoinducer peptide